MGTGFYNSKSLITVRLLTHRQEEVTDELIASRVKAACDYRRFVMNRPGTDSCRLIYGEADRLPGVIADRFGGVIVLQVLALGMERFTQTIADALLACEKPDCLLLQNDDAIRRKEGMECFTRRALRHAAGGKHHPRERRQAGCGCARRSKDGLLPRPEG